MRYRPINNRTRRTVVCCTIHEHLLRT